MSDFGLTPKSDINTTRDFNLQKRSDFGLTPKVSAVVGEDTFQPAPLEEVLTRRRTQEEAIEDPDFMYYVDRNLEARFKSGNWVDTGSKFLGGVGYSEWQKMPAKDRFEYWQNYHRSFAGGQTVTTANEVAYASMADEETKTYLGEGYQLFDSMPNIFSEETPWADRFDAVGDYMKAAIIDPTTVVSLGVGKALTSGGVKAAGQALRVSAKAAYTQAAKQALKSGATKAVADKAGKAAAKQLTGKAFMALGAKETAAYTVVDFAANVGSNIAYQDVLVDTGAQEKYQPSQTAIAAIGTVALPALLASGKGLKALTESKLAKDTLVEKYIDISTRVKSLNSENITEAVKRNMDFGKFEEGLSSGLQGFAENLRQHMDWTTAKEASDTILDSAGNVVSVGEKENLFFMNFMVGTEANPGFVKHLQDAGFVYVPRFPDDKISNFVGDAVSWVPDSYVSKFMDEYESATGFRPNIEPTATSLAAYLKKRASILGSGLNQYSQFKGILKGTLQEGATFEDFLDGIGRSFGRISSGLEATGDVAKASEQLGKLADRISKYSGAPPEVVPISTKAAKTEESPHWAKYVLSVWKRMVTSHPATTGANIKGWAMTGAANNASDLISGLLHLGAEAPYKLITEGPASAKLAIQRGRGSILGAMRRGVDVLNNGATAEAAEGFFTIRPEVREELFKVISGDSGAGNALKYLGIDPANKVVNATEKGIEVLQALSGMKMQDEITKQISFMSELNRRILMEYGVDYNTFLRNHKNAYVELFSPNFTEKVIAPSITRTQRETYSFSWSDLKSERYNPARFIAHTIEKVSSNAVGGYMVPFGKFFNTATATIGDYSGFNAMYHIIGKVTGAKMNLDSEEGFELFAKGIVGLTSVYIGGHLAQEKIKAGLPWNISRRDDGSLTDSTYDAPYAHHQLFSQMMGHYMMDGEIPAPLMAEASQFIVGQTFRQLDDSAKVAYEFIMDLPNKDAKDNFKDAVDISLSLFSKIFSGFTRPLDPVNQAAIMISGDYEQLDRRQGYKFWNDSVRYIDHIFGNLVSAVSDTEKRATPSRGLQQMHDFGKVMGGVRSAPEQTPILRMLNSVGIRDWAAVRWDGPPEVKNRLDAIVAPILNVSAEEFLSRNPKFSEWPLSRREAAVSAILEKGRAEARKFLKVGYGDDPVISLLDQLSQVPKKDLRRTMERMGIEGDVEDLAKNPNGKQQLELLLYLTKEYDKIFHKDY